MRAMIAAVLVVAPAAQPAPRSLQAAATECSLCIADCPVSDGYVSRDVAFCNEDTSGTGEACSCMPSASSCIDTNAACPASVAGKMFRTTPPSYAGCRTCGGAYCYVYQDAPCAEGMEFNATKAKMLPCTNPYITNASYPETWRMCEPAQECGDRCSPCYQGPGHTCVPRGSPSDMVCYPPDEPCVEALAAL